MNNNSVLRVVFVLAALIPLAGCNVMGPFKGHTWITNTAPTPVSGPGQYAKTHLEVSWGFVRVKSKQDWLVEGLPPLDMKEVVYAVRDRLDHSAEDWLGPVDDDGSRSWIGYIYDTRITIVCVNPVIAAVQPEDFRLKMRHATGKLQETVPSLPFAMHAFGKVRLPHGIQSGRSVASRQGVRLLDLSRPAASEQDPTAALELQPNGKAYHPTPWGTLEFTPAGEGFRVRGIDAAPPLLEPQRPEPKVLEELDSATCVIPIVLEAQPSVPNAP